MKRPLAIGAAAMLVLGCATMSQKPPNLSGQWGGRGIGLMLEGGLGRVEYDCASGTIDSAIIPGPDGRFSATGTHVPGQGGPVRVGQIFVSHRATYAGEARDGRMTLRVAVENGDVLGPFTLVEGAEPQLLRCL
ncbi:MAG TPA: hypothetical protein VFK58_02665 [Sphingomicrobium sp.]|nr:hypothetical protein [Sphingomicrobium sp.]